MDAVGGEETPVPSQFLLCSSHVFVVFLRQRATRNISSKNILEMGGRVNTVSPDNSLEGCKRGETRLITPTFFHSIRTTVD